MTIPFSLLFLVLSGSGNESAPRAERLRNESLVLQAAEVRTGDGSVFKPGIVIVLDGRVVAAGQAPPIPVGSRTIDCGDAVITPGLIDAACQLGASSWQGFSEQSSEVIPQLDAADAIDYFSHDFEQLASEGVTTIYLTGEAASVISSKGAAVKTAGPVDERKLAAKPCVKGTLGLESAYRGVSNTSPSRFSPPTFRARRPTTHMGSAGVFRKAFFDAKSYREHGATQEDPAAMGALLEVLDGKTALRMQVREAFDFDNVIRLCDEFSLPFVVEYGSEAVERIDLLAARKIPVIFGPVNDAQSGAAHFVEDASPAFSAPKLFVERGIPFCLTASDGIGDAGLARQCGIAIRHGLAADRALRAVTGDAAAMLGLDARVGRLAPGLDADLVVWNGAPFDDTSKPVLVLINGRPVFDPDHRFRKENS